MKNWRITFIPLVALSLATCSAQNDKPLQPLDDVMMQAFYWDVPVDDQTKNGTWWNHLSEIASELRGAGISSLWTPIPAKGNWGIYDSGYGIYDTKGHQTYKSIGFPGNDVIRKELEKASK